MEKNPAQPIIEPRDPVAYPRYPQRLRGAARPRIEVSFEPLESEQSQQPRRD